jgi:hypothetical protein
MSQGAEPVFYRVDVETFTGLRRIVRRLLGDDPLVEEDRRNLAIRMNALLQRVQPEPGRPQGPTTSSEYGAPSGLLKESFWKHRAHS